MSRYALRAAGGGGIDASIWPHLQGLTPQEARIVARLRFSSEPVERAALESALFVKPDVNSTDVLKVVICRLRRKLTPLGVEIDTITRGNKLRKTGRSRKAIAAGPKGIGT